MARSQDAATADEALARMGYQSELPRNLSMLSILGLYVPPNYIQTKEN